jgi:hypothetical protein
MDLRELCEQLRVLSNEEICGFYMPLSIVRIVSQ